MLRVPAKTVTTINKLSKQKRSVAIYETSKPCSNIRYRPVGRADRDISNESLPNITTQIINPSTLLNRKVYHNSNGGQFAEVNPFSLYSNPPSFNRKKNTITVHKLEEEATNRTQKTRHCRYYLQFKTKSKTRSGVLLCFWRW